MLQDALVKLAGIVKQCGETAGGGVDAFGAAELLGDHGGSAQVIPQAVDGSLALIGGGFLALYVGPQRVLDVLQDHG